MKALNDFGQRVGPEPKARAWCPYCRAQMLARCGEQLVHHWAHMGPTCEGWATASKAAGHEAQWIDRYAGVEAYAIGPRPPEGSCYTCERWQRRCTSNDPTAAGYVEDYVRPTSNGLVRVLLHAPPCAAHLHARRRTPYGPLTVGQIAEPEYRTRLERLLAAQGRA